MSYEKHEDKCRKAEIIDLHNEACRNTDCEKVLLTGRRLQLSVISVPCGGETGSEVREHAELLIRVECGCAEVLVGENKNCVKSIGKAACGDVIFIPEGTWFNIVNDGIRNLKLSVVSAPPEHKTKHDSK